ncbi:MAG: hypothetical protein JW904_11440 [Spirochaetales bacterium]|nr:hypothetical protein [Spirochaetales bacterium]
MKTILFVIFILLSGVAFAKGPAPKDVPAVVFEGQKYVVNHWGLDSAFKQNGGIIDVLDAATGKLIKKIQIYVIEYNPSFETDIQDVFITSIILDKPNHRLKITNQNGDEYYLDLRTHIVFHIAG